MNIVNKLTLRHLQQNKRRTLVTIIGVIISVAMITAVATIGVSFMELMQRQTIASEGEWHVLYKDVNKEQLEAVKKDEATRVVVISRDRGYAFLEGGQNKNKPYLFVKEYNARGFEQFPIELSQGRLPQSGDEVVISEEIAENAGVEYQLGDQIILDIGQRVLVGDNVQALTQNDPLEVVDGESVETIKKSVTQKYTIVGTIKRPIWEPAWAPGYTIISYVDESMLGVNDTVNAAVVLNKINSALYEHAENLAAKNDIDTVEFNNRLLRFYGVTKNDNLRSTLYSLTAIMMAVIIIGSIALIYNAFAISVSERSRYLGMLASVGATRRQKRNSVFFEGAIIGLISIPIGIIGGLAGIGITFWFIGPLLEGVLLSGTEKLTVSITPLSMLVAGVVSMLTIFISSYLPAQKASKISAIDAIRQTTEVKLTGKAVKTSRFIRRLFGIEAEIGLKNLKRNRRRYQATVFSLIISIVLFLTVSFFTANLQKSLELSQDGINFDIQVTISENAATDERLIKSIASLDEVTEFSVIKSLGVSSRIEAEAIAIELQKQLQNDRSVLEGNKFPYYIDIHALDAESLQAYAREVGVDYEKLLNPDTVAGIVIDTISYYDVESGRHVETKGINNKEIGQSLDLFYKDRETGAEINLPHLTIAALTAQTPMGVFPAGLGGLSIIVSEQVMEQLTDNLAIPHQQTKILLRSMDPMATQHEIEGLQESKLYIYNAYRSRQQEEQMLVVMSVFTYGFIVLITAISIANIFNTISTSIALRKREFAMLKSVGMTPKGFNKMLNYESIFYGIKSLSYGLPISVMVMYLIHRSLMHSFSYEFTLPWVSIGFVVGAVFVIVSAAMLYSSAKVKKENIIDALKQENI